MTDSFNEFERAQDERSHESARLQRQASGINEAAYQAYHAVWMIWVFRYEILSHNAAWGHYPIAHEYDEGCKNIAAN